MWARVAEVAVGCWLLMSPFIFGHDGEDIRLWWADLAGGSAIITLALVSFWRPLRRAHLLETGVGLWLIGRGLLSTTPTPPAVQNEMLVGLLILMLAIVPFQSEMPPESWRQAGTGSGPDATQHNLNGDA